jgi:hypothetical protein
LPASDAGWRLERALGARTPKTRKPARKSSIEKQSQAIDRWDDAWFPNAVELNAAAGKTFQAASIFSMPGG